MLGNKIKDILVGLVLAILPIVVSAQPRYIGEIGLRGGVAFYNGDINSSKVFRDLSPAAGAFLRFKANDFLNFKIDGGFANLKIYLTDVLSILTAKPFNICSLSCITWTRPRHASSTTCSRAATEELNLKNLSRK